MRKLTPSCDKTLLKWRPCGCQHWSCSLVYMEANASSFYLASP